MTTPEAGQGINRRTFLKNTVICAVSTGIGIWGIKDGVVAPDQDADARFNKKYPAVPQAELRRANADLAKINQEVGQQIDSASTEIKITVDNPYQLKIDKQLVAQAQNRTTAENTGIKYDTFDNLKLLGGIFAGGTAGVVDFFNSRNAFNTLRRKLSKTPSSPTESH